MKHKKLSIIVISCLVITSLLFGSTACAQDEELPDPGITPDSPFYFLDTWGKRIGMFFALGPEAKAKKALEYAEERLAESRAMAEKKKIREMTRAANDYNGFMAMVNERLEEARQQGLSDTISERVASAISKHLSVLDGVQEQVPGQAQEAIARAREASRNGQTNALRALAKNKLERALDISSATIENRLERARVKAAENVAAEVAEALDYAARITELEEEMTALAEEKGIDITNITQRLAQATNNRLEVLAGVYEKVPDKTQAAIENAIENSVRKYERAVEKLKEQNALGDVPEDAPALERLQEEAKERLNLTISSVGPVTENNTVPVRVQERVQNNAGEPITNVWPGTYKPPVSGNITKENKEANTQVRSNSDTP
jgi:hypothetical protein